VTTIVSNEWLDVNVFSAEYLEMGSFYIGGDKETFHHALNPFVAYAKTTARG